MEVQKSNLGRPFNCWEIDQMLTLYPLVRKLIIFLGLFEIGQRFPQLVDWLIHEIFLAVISRPLIFILRNTKVRVNDIKLNIRERNRQVQLTVIQPALANWLEKLYFFMLNHFACLYHKIGDILYQDNKIVILVRNA